MLLNITEAGVSRRVHRAAVGCFFFIQGLSFASWGSRIPSIQQKLGLSEAALGGVLFSLPVGLMLSLPMAGWLVSRVGSRKIVVAFALLYAATLVAVGMAQTTLQLICALFIFGLAGNMVNIAVNTQAVGVEALYRKSIMASFHGLWSLAGFCGAALGTLMIGLEVVPGQHFLIVLLLAGLVIAVASRFLLQEDLSDGEEKPIFAIPDKSLFTLGIIAFCSMICEGAMFDWSGVYFRDVLQVDKAMVGVGYTAFMCAMASTRFVADWFTSRFGLRSILQVSGVLTASGLMISVVFPTLVPAIIGFLLVGAGVSSVVPLIYSAAGKSKVMAPGAALAAVSSISFLGFLVGPPLIGLIAGATSLRISFTIIAAMGLCIAIVATRAKTIE